MAEIVIEKAREDDVPAIMELLEFANMHYVPSEEMPGLDWHFYFVARDGDRVVGAGGYKILSESEGKTQLMVVHPDYRRRGLGRRLQTERLEAMAQAGVKTVTTNADLPATIEWYKNHFGYRHVGTLKKMHEFGDPDIHFWTTLQLDLEAWVRDRNHAFQS